MQSFLIPFSYSAPPPPPHSVNTNTLRKSKILIKKKKKEDILSGILKTQASQKTHSCRPRRRNLANFWNHTRNGKSSLCFYIPCIRIPFENGNVITLENADLKKLEIFAQTHLCGQTKRKLPKTHKRELDLLKFDVQQALPIQ